MLYVVNKHTYLLNKFKNKSIYKKNIIKINNKKHILHNWIYIKQSFMNKLLSLKYL
jgi:hypothetical protein